MDKPNKNQTITIKINHKEQPFKNIEKEPQPKHRPKEDILEIQQWNSFEKEMAKETAATEDAREDDFDWILPELDRETEDYSWVPPKKQTVKKSKAKRSLSAPILPISLSIVFAILVGAIMGFFILRMVISDSASQPVDAVPQGESPTTEEETGAQGTLSITLPPLTAYLVQGGAFQTPEGAITEEATMLSKGIPAKAISKGEQSYLFVGISNNLENAKLLGAELQAKGIEIYAKEDSFGGTTLENLKEQDHRLLQAFPESYQLLTSLYSTLHSTGSLTDVLSTSFATLEKNLGEITEMEKEELKTLKGELDQAIASIKQFQETKDENELNAIQQHLLNALLIYSEL